MVFSSPRETLGGETRAGRPHKAIMSFWPSSWTTAIHPLSVQCHEWRDGAAIPTQDVPHSCYSPPVPRWKRSFTGNAIKFDFQLRWYGDNLDAVEFERVGGSLAKRYTVVVVVSWHGQLGRTHQVIRLHKQVGEEWCEIVCHRELMCICREHVEWTQTIGE